jgi:DNA primase
VIDNQTIARIHDAALIEEVVGDFVSLRKRGANLFGLCPFHNEKTPSFTVSPSRGIFKCFGCGEGGNSVHFIMKHENLSYVEALKYLANKYNIEIKEREITKEEKIVQNERENLLAINDFAAKYFAQNLEKTGEGKAVGKSYFIQKRNFTEETIKKFSLGYSIDKFDDFFNVAKQNGFSDEFLVKTGLVVRKDDGVLFDRFRGRVMFPIHSISGKIVAFGGRILEKKENVGKYLNSPESEVYHKSNELYGIYFAKNEIVKQDRCFLVEGYTDVISMWQAGVRNVVASSGTSLTQGQIKLIHRFTPNITIIYDGDAAGIKASIRGIDLLLQEGMNIKTLLLPEGEDPDSFARTHNGSDFIEYLNTNQIDFIKFKISILQEEAKDDPIKKAALIGDVIRSIAIIPDLIIKQQYAKECSILLDVEENVIYNQINKLERERKREEQKKLETKQKIDETADENLSDEEHQNTDNQIVTPQKKDRTYKFEYNLIEKIISSGTTPLVPFDNEKGYLVAGEYIMEKMREFELEWKIPIFKDICNEFAENKQLAEEELHQHFLNHSNPEFSKIAAETFFPKHVISKYFTNNDLFIDDANEKQENDKFNIDFSILKRQQQEEKINNLLREINKLIGNYYEELLNNQTKSIKSEIKLAEQNGDNQQQATLFKELNIIAQKKSQISRNLGSSPIRKF